jgi:ribonucleotide monophosphatase NagD (HAD superfamily)
MVMIGDQLATDIRGARAFGLDSVLIASGIANIHAITVDDDHLLPTYVMQSIFV